MKKQSKIFMVGLSLFLIMGVMLSPVVRAQTDEDPNVVVTIDYSFEEVRSSITGVVIYDQSGVVSTLDQLQASTMRWSSIGYTDIGYAFSLPYLSDDDGVKLDEDDAIRDARVIEEIVVGDTLVQYYEYYYTVDTLVRSRVVLPQYLPTEQMRFNGWDGLAIDRVPYNNWDVSNDESLSGYLFVLEETAPESVWNAWDYWEGFIINTYGYEPQGDVESKDEYLNYCEHYAMLPYVTDSIDMDAITDQVGGDKPIDVQLELSVELIPFISRNITIVDEEKEYVSEGTYASIVSATVSSTDFGLVANEFANEIEGYLGLSDVTTPVEQVDEDNIAVPSEQDDTGSTSDDEDGEDNGQSITVSVDVAPTTSTHVLTSFTEGYAVGTPLPMFIGENSYDGIENTDLQLIVDAPSEVTIKPIFTIQPLITTQTRNVYAEGKYVTYTDPKRGILGNPFYTDNPDSIQTQDFNIYPITNVKVENTFILTSITYKTIVANVYTDRFALEGTGDELEDPTWAGYNEGEIEDPGDATATIDTPVEVLPLAQIWANIWANLADQWNDFWAGAGIDPGIMTIIIVIAVVVVLGMITFLVARSRSNVGMGRGQFYTQFGRSPTRDETKVIRVVVQGQSKKGGRVNSNSIADAISKAFGGKVRGVNRFKKGRG